MAEKCILCLTETKGNLSIINELAIARNASMVFHCGDFGFHDQDSIERLSIKEIRSILQYSKRAEHLRLTDIPDTELKKTLLRQGTQLSELPDFISGKKHFVVPVYVIWGNQEDLTVLEKFRSGTIRVANLFLVDENLSVDCIKSLNNEKSTSINSNKTTRYNTPLIMNIQLAGIGGSFVTTKLFDVGDGKEEVAGNYSGNIWNTLFSFGALVLKLEKANWKRNPINAPTSTASPSSGPSSANIFERRSDEMNLRILLTHCTPAKEFLLSQLISYFNIDLLICGGLHSRFAAVYTPFTICSGDNESLPLPKQIQRKQILRIANAVRANDDLPSEMSKFQLESLEAALRVINSPSLNDFSMKSTWIVVLSDANVGNVAIKIDQEQFKYNIETYSEGIHFKKSLAATNREGSGVVDSLNRPNNMYSSFSYILLLKNVPDNLDLDHLQSNFHFATTKILSMTTHGKKTVKVQISNENDFMRLLKLGRFLIDENEVKIFKFNPDYKSKFKQGKSQFKQ